jgi:hypothetical protein
MSPRRIAAGRARAVKAILVLAAASACLGAVAYAAIRAEGPAAGLAEGRPLGASSQHGAGARQGRGEEAPPRPRFIERPEAVSSLAEPQFRFHVPPRTQRPRPQLPGEPSGEPAPTRRFQCRLDDGGWRDCSSPHRLGGLAPGDHAFAVRAFNRADRPGPALHYAWRQVEPPRRQEQADAKPFSIKLQGELEHLHPGYPAQQLPVLIANPNSVPIEVTGLTVGVAGDPPACSAENFELTPSSVSPAAPLTVPAGGTVRLPTATVSAPSIRMLNLPVDQDACQGTEIPLAFGGEARG